MLGKIIKILLLINIVFAGAVFGQAGDKTSGKLIAAQYDSWLKLTRLNGLLQVESFTPAGYVLVLKPARSFTDIKTFALAFNNVRAGLNKQGLDIYKLLFNKLEDYSFMQSDSLTLLIETAEPKKFALKIYYDEQLKHEETIVLERGQNAVPELNLNTELATDKCIEVRKPLTTASVLQSLDRYFKNYKSAAGRPKIDSIVNNHQAGIKYRISNIDGIVTKTRLHEVILLNISVDAKGFCYTVDISYAGGMKAPDADKTEFYHEAALKFKTECATYERKLAQDLNKIF
ncbi:MAG: hypothetical protein V4577_20380 [Bacteroidota bacterium]